MRANTKKIVAAYKAKQCASSVEEADAIHALLDKEELFEKLVIAIAASLTPSDSMHSHIAQAKYVVAQADAIIKEMEK